jgi:hypothetical protein
MALGADVIYQGARPLPLCAAGVWLPVHVGLAIRPATPSSRSRPARGASHLVQGDG